MILRPPTRPPAPPDPVARLARLIAAEDARPRPALLHPAVALLPSLYRLLPLEAILPVLERTGTASLRVRRVPAQEAVWLVVASSLFRDRSIPMAWRHVHPSSATPSPSDSAFTKARQRLGALPMRLLFHRVCRPIGAPGPRVGPSRRPWLVVALDGSTLDAPDTPANRRVLGSASNQSGPASFPQLRLSALCEVGTHAVTDVEIGPYAASEQALSLRLLRRLPAGRLVLMDRGLSYFPLVRAVVRRRGHVLARVKVSRALPVERALPDGSYLSTIHPSFNDRRAGRGGIRVRVVRYTHGGPCRAGAGGDTVLITTALDWRLLPAEGAVALYPWRWEEESVFAEIKVTMLLGGKPHLRSKTPTLALQEAYGLLIGHYLVRREMAAAAVKACVGEAARLSFKRCLEVLEDRMRDKGGPRWAAGLRREMGQQPLGPKRVRAYPRVIKGGRSCWPNKKPGAPPPPQPDLPFNKAFHIKPP